MMILVNIIVMFSSFLIAYFMKDITAIVNRNLILYSVSFLLTGVEYLSSILVNRSWYLLFCTICKSKKAWKVLFNFFLRFQPFGYWIYFLWNWYTLSYQFLNLVYISANVTL